MLSDDRLKEVARSSLAKYGFEKEAPMVALVAQELRNAVNTFASANLVVVEREVLRCAADALCIANDWHVPHVQVNPPAAWNLDPGEEDGNDGWCSTRALAHHIYAVIPKETTT